MKLSRALLFSTQLLVAISLPISTASPRATANSIRRKDSSDSHAQYLSLLSRSSSKHISAAAEEEQEGTTTAVVAPPKRQGFSSNEEAAAGAEYIKAAGEGEGGGKEEKKENEKEIEGRFNVPVRLGGASLKQDVLFPPGKNGRLEVEFQNSIGRTLIVTENRAPAAPPPGFIAAEPVSYKVNLAEGAQGMTLSKIDYILNAGNALDISKGKIGRLFPEANAFIIDPALGELEFEAEEKELTLKVANMNGEFAVFLPQAGGASGAAGAACV